VTFGPFVPAIHYPAALDTTEELRTAFQMLYSDHILLVKFCNALLAEARKVQGAALTAADTTTVNSGDSGTDDVINNHTTRLGEIEAILEANLLAAEN